MFSLQKSGSNRTRLGYGFSSFNIASTSTTVFVPPSNNVEIENNNVKTDLVSENLDKGKSILGPPSKQDKKEAKNPRAKKANSQKPKQKKQHLYHHCGVAGHTRPNCYKWLATQQSNGMIASGSQNQLQSSLVLFNMFLFGYFSVLLCFVFHINFFFFVKSEKYKNGVCFVYIGTCVPWMAIETRFSKLFVSLVA